MNASRWATGVDTSPPGPTRQAPAGAGAPSCELGLRDDGELLALLVKRGEERGGKIALARAGHDGDDGLPLRLPRAAIFAAAATMAPALMPLSIPSSFARRSDIAMASSLCTGITSSTTSRSIALGTKPAPIPWILCGEGLNSAPCFFAVIAADSCGSTATMVALQPCSLRYCATPVTVPPVPTPDTT